MSIRLNVVVSQSAGGTPQRRELESDLVARLIGAPGMDLSLIGPLESLAENSTDRLLLERLGGDLALLSWETPAVAAERLAACHIPGRRAPHPLDAEAAAIGSASGERRIFHHPLADHSAATLQAALERLLASRRVVTFQLAPAAPHRPVRPSLASPRPASPPDRHAAAPNPHRPIAAQEPVAEPTSTADRWDALVDELNDLDI
ncbi:hypothetical protein [Candidatus Laterigemmans baculatus]|uniref:hypothetical protein n=1 Tax=Candidatus Laterigemmans baculatus TaxID=2770505 RepID=UPI0013DD5615|nr:hypothetical protein [Candidatus Laterigemmans baculatus]